ncbi:iron-sulfur cluster assembly scaffold protein [Patescibacteria group bacterium]|nr:MAG: iron-sulfur cluster assembly scaffold protein [Patescibacteria group bacterium]
MPDVTSRDRKQSWFYSDTVKEHFFRPKNFIDRDVGPDEYDATGKVGSPACGDELRVWMKVDPESERIREFRWKTFGCGSAIASTSMASVMVTENGGMTLDEARDLKPQDIMARLGGLPARKFHCSVLCDKALRDAINDYYRRAGKTDKMVVESARLVDPVAKVTDRDIEEAVLEGAHTLEAVQQKTKVGIGNPGVLPAAEELIRFYKEKYFG